MPVLPTINETTRRGINALILLGLVLALHLGEPIIIPTIIALLLNAMLWPAVHWMNQRLRFSWAFACLVAVGGLVVLNIFVTLGFLLAVPKLLQDLPDLRNEVAQEQIYERFRDRVGMILPLDETYLPAQAGKSRLFLYVKDTLENDPFIGRALWQITYYSNIWIWEWVLIMFLLLFMLLEGPMLGRRIVEIFGPSEDAKDKAVHVLADMAHQVRTYLVWRTIINFGLGLLVGLVYQYGFHLKQAWTWAILTAILFYIPYLGPLVAGVFPVIEAFYTTSPWAALAIMAVYAVILTLEGYLLVPVVMGHSLELNATTVMLACLFWDLVWGLPGLFLAMPLMAAIKAICRNVPSWRPWANLMSTASADAPARPSRSVVLPALKESSLLAQNIHPLEATHPAPGD